MPEYKVVDIRGIDFNYLPKDQNTAIENKLVEMDKMGYQFVSMSGLPIEGYKLVFTRQAVANGGRRRKTMREYR
jgi:hypothetical protein